MGPRLLLALLAGLLCAGASAQPVRGLIVQLREAPSHERLADEREKAQALRQGRPTPLASEQARWLRVLQTAGVSEAPRFQPVGHSARLLRLTRPLTREQAEQLASRLRESADVAWVEPNARERRLQAVEPSDPCFSAGSGGVCGDARQWWLRPVSGSDANALENRLRGVPGFQTAWSRSTGAANSRVAVLDSGISAHPDMVGRFLPGYDFVHDWDPVAHVGYANDGDGRDADATDPGDWVSAEDQRVDAARYADCAVEASSWHGTLVSGLIAASTDNGIGVAGINWAGKILPVRVAGKCGADVVDIVDGMRWAAGLRVCKSANTSDASCNEFVANNPNPARIINISFGGSETCGNLYQEAIDDVRAQGALVVAAAGNEHGKVTRPASCSGVVGVAALNRDGFKTSYSNFGSRILIATVGGDDAQGAWGATLADSGLLTLSNDGVQELGSPQYARLYGTSFATPLVSGAMSLMLSVNPALSADQIIAGLRASARPHVTSPWIEPCSADNPGRCICTTTTCGAGMLDADEALRYAEELKAGRSYMAPNWSLVSLDSSEVQAAAQSGPDRPANNPPSSGGGGGGGALGLGWLLALALACAALWRTPRARA